MAGGFSRATAWLAATMGCAVAASSRGALSARASLPDTGACILPFAWNCGLGRKWLEPDKGATHGDHSGGRPHGRAGNGGAEGSD